MQHVLGNNAVGRMLAQRMSAPQATLSTTKTDVSAPAEPTSFTTQQFSVPVSATFRRVKEAGTQGRQDEAPTIKPVPFQDAPPGRENDPDPFQYLSAQPDPKGGDIAEPEEGQKVALPDITFSNVAEIPLTDAIVSILGPINTITNSGSPSAGDFGTTVPSMPTMSNITVTSASSVFIVSATVNYSVRFAFLTGTGPGGEKDVTSDTSPLIKASNYTTVASDLTPNMGDLGGRPPRTQFFASDLTAKHERFHADDSATRMTLAVTLQMAWLNGQTAASVADVNTLLGQVPGRAFSAMMAGMAAPGREIRAYGDGAPSYTARANSISTKGAAGQYPA
jgi:hypothetical protein